MCSIDDVDEAWDMAGKSVSVDYCEPFQKWYRLYMWTGSQMYYTLYLLSGFFFFLGTSLKLDVSILYREVLGDPIVHWSLCQRQNLTLERLWV